MGNGSQPPSRPPPVEFSFHLTPETNADMSFRIPAIHGRSLVTVQPFLMSAAFAMTLWVILFPPGRLDAQTIASGETHVPAPYTPQVWDIDWSYLANHRLRQDWTDDLHYIALGSDRSKYLSITGQIRERGEYHDHPAFGAQPPDNGYFLQRYLLSANLHSGPRFRAFIQAESAIVNGRDGGPRPGIDESKLDINQGFVDLKLYQHGKDDLNVRTGRQLVSLGSTRLVAIGAGLNVEQPFDGVRLTLHHSSWTAEGLALRPVSINSRDFNNEPNSSVEFWGLYLTHPVPRLKQVFIDVYYLGFDHKSAHYAQGTGREQRETVGARIWSHKATWDYDFEYTGQFGRFGPGDIRAWGTGYHLGYTYQK